MHVHSIKVSYLREKQPKDYEKAAPSIELSAALDDNEDHAASGLRLMHDACKIVYAGLGYDIPEGVLAKLNAGSAPAGTVLKSAIGDVVLAPIVSAAQMVKDGVLPDRDKEALGSAVGAAAAPVEGAPRGRGRPPGSKGKVKADTAGGVVRDPTNPMTNGSEIPETTPIAINEPFENVNEDGSVIPDGKPVAKLGDNISRNPEDRQDPAAGAVVVAEAKGATSVASSTSSEAKGADIPFVAPTVVAPVSAEPTPADLQLFIQKIMKEHPKLVTIEKVKGVISQHGVARVSDLVKDGVSQVGSVKKMIEALVPAKAA